MSLLTVSINDPAANNRVATALRTGTDEAAILTDLFGPREAAYLDTIDDHTLRGVIAQHTLPKVGSRYLHGSWFAQAGRLRRLGANNGPIILPDGDGRKGVLTAIGHHTLRLQGLMQNTPWADRAVASTFLYSAELLPIAHAHTDTNDEPSVEMILRSVLNLTGPHAVCIPNGADLPFIIQCNDRTHEVNPLFKDFGPIRDLHAAGKTFMPPPRSALVFPTDEPLRTLFNRPLVHGEPDQTTHPYAGLYRLQALSLVFVHE